MNVNLDKMLREFAEKEGMKGKGPLCVALVVTRHARDAGLPLAADKLLTDAEGQVAGLGKAAVQSILKDHGIVRTLAEEGGRTSRGSVGNMKKYVAFLNNLHSKKVADLTFIEEWWIRRVRAFFAEKPFVLNYDTSKSLRAVVRDLLAQAQKRQSQFPGSTFAGTMLQHLVGAKLNILLPAGVKHHGASVADDLSGRPGDFIVEDVAIHVTMLPSEALMKKCAKNLANGLKPVIITTAKGALVAEGLAEPMGIVDRVDIFEAEQFLAGNLYEIGKFGDAGRKATATQLVAEYNKITEEHETDPSLRIEVSK